MKKIISLILCATMAVCGCFAVSADEAETSVTASETEDTATDTAETEETEAVSANSDTVEETEKETEAESSLMETEAETDEETEKDDETAAETDKEAEKSEETEKENDTEAEDESDEESEEETKAPVSAKKYLLYYEDNHLDLYGELEGAVVMPEKAEAAEKSFWTVEAPQYDDPLYSVKGSKVYKLSFEGYNTSEVGDGTHYDVGDEVAAKEDTVLYAIWTYELVSGQIVIRANTVEPDDADAPDSDEFRISVKGDSEKAKLLIFDSDGELREDSDVSLPVDIILHDGEEAVLDVLPGTYSLMRDAVENYGFDSDSEAAKLAEEIKDITVTSLNECEIKLDYYYIEPLGEITVSRSGADTASLFAIEGISETNQDIGFTFVIPQGKKSVTVTNLPAGDYVITYDGAWSVCYIPDAGAAECSIDSMGDEARCGFELTFVTAYWLYGDTYVSDHIGKSKK